MESKTEVKHTPTPWKTLGSEGKEWYKLYRPNGGGLFATIEFTDNVLTEEKEANAAFIVQAVNSHDELLESAKIGLKIAKDSGMNEKEDESVRFIVKAISNSKGTKRNQCRLHREGLRFA